MKKLFSFSLLALTLALVATPRVAEAASIQMVLDCTMTNPGSCPLGGPFGTLTLTDNGNGVVITIDLVSNNPVSLVSLNWSAAAGPLPPEANFLATGGNIGANTITVANNAAGAFGRFDLAADPTGSPTDPLVFTLLLFMTAAHTTAVNLDALFFHVSNGVAANLWGSVTQILPTGGVAVHAITQPGVDLEEVGSPVPEPAGLLLLGFGLLGLAAHMRRQNRGKLI